MEEESVQAIDENTARELLQHLADGMQWGDLQGFVKAEYEALYTIGFSLYNQAKYTDALKIFAFLVVNQHLERRYLMAYAATFQMLKKFKQALQYYSMTSFLDLKDPIPTFHSAECMIELGMLKEAEEALNFVIAQAKKQQKYPELKTRAELILQHLKQQQAKENSKDTKN